MKKQEKCKQPGHVTQETRAACYTEVTNCFPGEDLWEGGKQGKANFSLPAVELIAKSVLESGLFTDVIEFPAKKKIKKFAFYTLPG